MAVMSLNNSQFIIDKSTNKHASRFVRALHDVTKKDFSSMPNGVFGSEAKIICGNVTINSNELDFEFNVPFDDDMEPNEAEIVIYNLTNSTIAKFKYKSKLSIEAGYKGDTGVIFNGYISKVHTVTDGPDKVTTIRCLDDMDNKTIESIEYSGGTKASYILKDLLKKTNTPIAVFKTRRDHTYKDSVTVEGDLTENIKRFAEICGISVFVSKGKIYARYIKDGDNLNFTLSEDTGLIGSVEPFEEEVTAEDFKETVSGYTGECLLQHRMTTAGIINLKSLYANGTYRIRKGEHVFNPNEAITRFEVI